MSAACPSPGLESATPAESPAGPHKDEETPTEGRGEARGRVVIPAFRPSDEAMAAYVDLHRSLLRVVASGEEVPCRGAGAEAWTSGKSAEQEVAADRCLDCPAMALCARYAELAEEPLGTWGGVTRDHLRPARVAPGSAPVASAEGRWCGCDCGGTPKRGRYLPGHDARHLARLVRDVRAGAVTSESASRALSGSPRLQAKLADRLGASGRLRA